MNGDNINAFAVAPHETHLFFGNKNGELAVVDINAFEIVRKIQAHDGTIEAVAIHPSLPLVAALGQDRRVSIWQYDEQMNAVCLHNISIRNITPDSQKAFHSVSQALVFHDKERRLVTRTGNGALLELGFDENSCNVLRCIRVFGKHDIVTARYVKNEDDILAGSIRGEVALIAGNDIVKHWKFGDESIHWLEWYEDSSYLIASDARMVIQLDITDNRPPIVGEKFARDDFEHVTHCRVSKKVYGSSHDRTVYAIDPDSCCMSGVIWKSPFKCRWIKVLEGNPSIMLVQCRNGGLYKIDVNNGATISVIKETPDAIWSGVKTNNGDLVYAGDGDYFCRLSSSPGEHHHYHVKKNDLGGDPISYTKRVCYNSATDSLAFGRTDGDILLKRAGEVTQLINVGSSIRDLEFDDDGKSLYVACENGRLLNVEIASKSIKGVFESQYPLWALAVNGGAGLVAVAERMGAVLLLEAESLKVVHSLPDHRRIKRMKWADSNRLLYGESSSLVQFDLKKMERRTILPMHTNTLEDFIWDPRRRYLIFINYQRNVVLCDYETGEGLYMLSDQVDYSKGLCMVDDTHFITYGRCGMPVLYRIHDERMINLGPLCLHS